MNHLDAGSLERILAVCAGTVPDNLRQASAALGATLNVTRFDRLRFHLASSIYDAVVVVEASGPLDVPFTPWRLEDPRPVPLIAYGPRADDELEAAALVDGAWEYVHTASTPASIATRLRRVAQMGRRLREQSNDVDRLTLLTRLDDVTGLHNQGYLRERLTEELSRARRFGHPLSVLMLDVDRFKLVNDTMDHLVGTSVLQQLARLLRHHLRRADVLCRYGGDEFVAILPHVDLAAAIVAAERARRVIAAHAFAAEGRIVRITASFGAASFPEHDIADGEGLMRLADHAMYLAKNSGRDCSRALAVTEPALAIVG